MVIPTEVVALEGRFGFRPTGSEVPLPCFYLRSASFFGVLRRTFCFNQCQFATLACLTIVFSFDVKSFHINYLSQAVEEGRET